MKKIIRVLFVAKNSVKKFQHPVVACDEATAFLRGEKHSKRGNAGRRKPGNDSLMSGFETRTLGATTNMTVSTFETPDGEEIEIDGDDVVSVRVGKESDTTVVELEDGDEIVVAAGRLEVIAELDLDPMLHEDPEEDLDPDDSFDDGDD